MKKTVLAGWFFLMGLFSASAQKEGLSQDSVWSLLTGGPSAQMGKTWWVSPSPNRTAVGSSKALVGNYFTYPDGLTEDYWTKGILANDYTFRNDGMYIPRNTNVTARWDFANYYFGYNQPQYADRAIQDPRHKQAHFVLEKTVDSIGVGYSINVLDSSYIGYFDHRHVYQIMSINEDSLYLRHLSSDEVATDTLQDELARYFTFVSSSFATSLPNDRMEEGKTLLFYPNPVRDQVILEASVQNATVCNSEGMVILQGKGTLNVGHLSKGMYILRMQGTDGSLQWQKMLKE